MTRKLTREEQRAAYCRLGPGEVWRKAWPGEDWSPNFPGDKLKCAVLRPRSPGDPCRVLVRGMDDSAMERDGLTLAEAEQLLRDLPEPLPRWWLVEKGFRNG